MKRLLLTLAFFTTIAVHIGAYTVRYMVGREPVKVVYNTTKVESNMSCPNEFKTIVEDGVTWTFHKWKRTLETEPFYNYLSGDISLTSNFITADYTIYSNTDVYAVYIRSDYDCYEKVTNISEISTDAGNYIFMGGVKLSSTQYYPLKAEMNGSNFAADKSEYYSKTAEYKNISTISKPTDKSIVWTIYSYNGTYTIYNRNKNVYIGSSKSGNNSLVNSSSASKCTFSFYSYSDSQNSSYYTLKTYNTTTKDILVASFTTNTNYPHFDWDSDGEISLGAKSWIYLYKERKPFKMLFHKTLGIEIVEWLSTNQVKIESYVLHKTSTPYTSDYTASYTTKNSDGTYTVQFYKTKGQTLGLRWYDLGSYIKYQSVKVPHMYSGTNTWSSVTATTYQPDTGEDIVLLRNATVTSSWDYTLNKITLYPGSTLNLTGGTIQVDTLILHTDGDEFTSTLPVINFKGGTLNVMKLFIDRRIDESRFYWLGTPYTQYFTTASQSTSSDIMYADFYANGAVLPDMNTDYFIYAYDGKTRNTENIPASLKSYWTPIETLHGSTVGQINNGNAFLFGINDQKASTGHTYRTYRFYQYYFNNSKTYKSLTSTETAIKQVTGVTTNYDLASAENAPEGVTDNNKGWNLLSNPYLHPLTFSDGATNILCGDWDSVFVDGKWTGEYEIRQATETIPYLTIYQVATDSYRQRQARGSTVAPLSTFFVQMQSGNKIQFSKSLTASRMPAYRRLEAEPKEKTIYADIYLTQERDDSLLLQDQCGLALRSDFTRAYELGADLGKMSKKGLYCYLTTGNEELAYAALSEELAQNIPLAFGAPENGIYTFSLGEQTDISYFDALYLTDTETNTTTNLLYDTYSFHINSPCTSTNRFYLSTQLQSIEPNSDEQITTDLAQYDNNIVQATIMNQTLQLTALPIGAQIYIYDMNGKLITSCIAKQSVLRFDLQHKGFFTIHINDNDNRQSIKVVVP